MAESAKKYLTMDRYWDNRWLAPRLKGKGELIYFNKKHRLWLKTPEDKEESAVMIHICKPIVVHHVISKGSSRVKDNIGLLYEQGSWFKKDMSYRCSTCRKTFSGGIAFAIGMSAVGQGRKLVERND
jgi:hypothetical protein